MNHKNHKNQMNNNDEKSNKMMTQKKEFGATQETINLIELADWIEAEADLTADDSIANEPQRQKLRVVLTGSRKVVTSTIHNLQLKNYAQVGDWSRSVPNPSNPEEVISILVRYITVQ